MEKTQRRNTVSDLSRRAFLRRASAATVAPLILPRKLFGATAPSNRITIGMIGMGRQAYHANLPAFLNAPDAQVVAVCDVDSWRCEQGRQKVDQFYGGKGCAVYRDFRELLARPDIDAVMISTPDHWHVPMAMAAAKAGKDIALEKPLTMSIAEGRLLADTVCRYGRVFRTDSEFRSSKANLLAVELVRNGHIGRLHTIRTGTPREHGTVGSPPPMPLPAELDYDAWLGPAPAVPYTMERVHAPRQLAARPGWMRVRDYCDGMILNWGTHLNDIAQWGNNTDRTGPVEVEARGKYPDDGGLWDVLIDFEAEYRYANGVKLVYKMDHAFIRFEGDEGWIEVDKGLKAHPRTILSGQIGTEEITFPLKTEKRDFLDAIKTRGTTLEDAEVGHRTASVCHLAHISIQLGGRKLRWDPDREVFPDDPLANRLLHRPAFRTTDSRNISGT